MYKITIITYKHSDGQLEVATREASEEIQEFINRSINLIIMFDHKLFLVRAVCQEAGPYSIISFFSTIYRENLRILNS